LPNVALTGASAGSAVLPFGMNIDFRAVKSPSPGTTCSAVTLESLTVSGNTATGKGGGIYVGGAA
jgi:predicted outer membrane repeat protein